MSDVVQVRLVGGPMDGTVQDVERTSVYEDPDPGTYLIPDSDLKAPADLPGGRVVYGAAPGEDPTVWHWQGWAP